MCTFNTNHISPWENNSPRGICECFQIHSLMPSFPWRVKAPHVVIASFPQISRNSKSQHCLCHNKFSCSDLKNFAPSVVFPPTCILHSGNILSACYLHGHLNVKTEPTAPFLFILYCTFLVQILTTPCLDSVLPSNWSLLNANPPVHRCRNKFSNSPFWLRHSCIFDCIKHWNIFNCPVSEGSHIPVHQNTPSLQNVLNSSLSLTMC